MKKWRLIHIAIVDLKVNTFFMSLMMMMMMIKMSLETWGDNCLFVCLFVCLMNCFKDFPTKEIIKKIALLCELIPKTLQSLDPTKGQEEA
jgi:hypothetical protein